MLTSRPTPSVENRVCSSRSFRFASSPRSKTSSWSARRPAACSPRRNRQPSLTSISQPALRSAESRACRSWGIRGSRRMVEASVSAVLPQLAKDRRCSDFLTLMDVWLLNRPCQTPRRRSLWGRISGTSVAETVFSTRSDSTGSSAGFGRRLVRRTSTTTPTSGRVRTTWRRGSRSRPSRVWGTSTLSRRMGRLSGTPLYQTRSRRAGNSPFRSKVAKEARKLSGPLGFRSMHHAMT